MVVTRVVVVRHRLVLAAAEVAAATAAATAEAARHDGANDDTGLLVGRKETPPISITCFRRQTNHKSPAYLHRRRRDHKVRVHVLLAKLLGNVQAQRAVVVVDVALRLIAEDRVGAVDFLELCRGVGTLM